MVTARARPERGAGIPPATSLPQPGISMRTSLTVAAALVAQLCRLGFLCTGSRTAREASRELRGRQLSGRSSCTSSSGFCNASDTDVPWTERLAMDMEWSCQFRLLHAGHGLPVPDGADLVFADVEGVRIVLAKWTSVSFWRR